MSWDNHFLDELGADDLEALRPLLSQVSLERNQLLDEPGQTIGTVYLPIDCVLSVVTVMRSGAQVESRTIGCESGYGLLNALGSPISFERMIVQIAGRAWALPLASLREAARARPGLIAAIVQHGQATLVQTAQGIACNTLHSAEQRLCRWLLMTQDRVRADQLPLTQEHMAIMLGVQRTTVTAVASGLQERGWISYVRGKIRVHDRPALERAACECYAAVSFAQKAVLHP
jgi:CRP-like cAMP-binding protein